MQMTLGCALELGMVGPVEGSDVPVVPPTTGATSPITTILAEGWQAQYPTPPTFDPEGSPETVQVHRQGFDLNATPTQHSDTLTVMTRLRHPYPGQDTLTSDQVVLSDYIYAGDTLSGVSNTSTRLAPLPLAMWLNHDRERITGPNHTFRLAVAHAHARAGQPVAAVTFSVSDGTTTLTQTVSTMSTQTYAASGLSVPHFAADMDLSTLTPGAVLVVDAVIYPWVGVPFTLSSDGDPYPSPNLTTLRVLNDATGSYGTVYAYVDAVLGDNGSAVASDLTATAAAAPFADTNAAAAAIKAQNNALYGRNTADGGVIRLAEGVHDYLHTRVDGAAFYEVPLLIEAADPSKATTTILQDPGTSKTSSVPRRVKFRNLTLRKQGGNVIFLDNGSSTGTGLLVVENCIWDLNGTSPYAAWVYRVGQFCQINNTGDAGQTPFFSNAYKASGLIGCNTGSTNGSYRVIGTRGTGFALPTALGPRPAAQGAFVGWSMLSAGSGGNAIVRVNSTVGPRGFAMVGNVVESWGAHATAAVQINADGNESATENLVMQHNTVVGQRLNFLYLDAAQNVAKSGYLHCNVFERMNVKGDVFAAQTTHVGNWSERYKVSWSHNAALSGSNNGSDYTPMSWLGEMPSLGEVQGIDPLWLDDRSNSGSDIGGGDYTPTAASPLPMVPAGKAAYPVDMLGRALTTGTARIGAVQPL
jgi:hypothetical protein